MKTDRPDGVGEVLDALAEIRDVGPSQARSLPTGFYTSEEYLELEKEEIFRKEWVCVGLVAEIPKCGDYFTTQLLDEPLIVVRGQDKKVRVLSNVCRHRSSVIVEGKGTTKHFVCPYHAWTYGSDGQLLRAPYMDQVKGFDVKSCRLPEFKTEVWHGFLYVNLDGKAKPLAPGSRVSSLILRSGTLKTWLCTPCWTRCGRPTGSAWPRTTWRATT